MPLAIPSQAESRARGRPAPRRRDSNAAITVIAGVLTLDKALDLANRTEYGLTAGIYSEDEDELRAFDSRVRRLRAQGTTPEP